MIVFTCSGCGMQARVPDNLAGQKVRCPGCKGVNAIPPAAAPEPVLEAQVIPEAPPAPAPEQDGVRQRPSPAPAPLRRDDRNDERDYPDEEERRDRRRPAPKRGSMVPLLVVGGVLAFGVVVAVGAAGLYFVFRPARAVPVGAAPVAAELPKVPEVPAEQWQPFSPVGGDYTVSMPGAPVENNAANPNLIGRHFDLDRPADRLHFTAEHFVAPSRFGLGEIYREEREEALRTRNGTLVAEADLQLDGVAGLEFRARMPDGLQLVTRVYVVRHQRYSRCWVISVRHMARERDEKTFLDSFRIHKGADGGLVQAPPEKQPKPQPQPQPPDQPLQPHQEPEPEKHVLVNGPTTTKAEQPVWQETGSDRTMALAFSGDSKTLIVGHFDKRIRLWDVRAGKDRTDYQVPDRHVQALASSADGKLFAAGLGQGVVALLDLEKNKEVGRATVQHKTAKEHCEFTALAFSADGKSLAIGIQPNSSPDGQVHLWSLSEKRVVATLSKGGETPKRLAFVPGGRLVVGFRSFAVVCDGATLRVEREIKQSSDRRAFIATAVAPDGKTLAAICEDKKIRHYDLSTGKVTKVWQHSADAHKDAGFPLVYSPDGTLLVFGAQGCILHLFDAKTGKEVRRTAGDGASGYIDLLTFSPDGKLLALHGDNGPRVLDCADLAESLKP